MNKLYVGLTVIIAQVANMRIKPGVTEERVELLQIGHTATITDGPTVTDNLTWWQLDRLGWCAESVNGEDLIEVAPATDFEKAVFFVFMKEGFYSNDPNDPGGATKYGISQRAYPNVKIETLSKEAARNIYYNDYWLAGGCDALSWPLNAIHFDSAVNCGLGRAGKFLAESNNDPKAYVGLRRSFYEHANQFAMYGKGWLNRMDDLERFTSVNREGQSTS